MYNTIKALFKAGTFLLSIILVFSCGEEKKSSQAKEEKQEPALGELVYTKNCKVCHAQGINGAPILGNKAMWGPRLDKGQAMLVSNASNGFGLMPAKGGNTALTEQEIADAISYMLSKVQ